MFCEVVYLCDPLSSAMLIKKARTFVLASSTTDCLLELTIKFFAESSHLWNDCSWDFCASGHKPKHFSFFHPLSSINLTIEG